MPDESYVVHEQARAAAQWEASCASDDALKRQIRAQLSEGRLGAVNGVSKSRRGTGRPTEVEREVEGQGAFLHAHEACYKPWREESVARRAADRPDPQSAYVAGRTLKWLKGEAGTLSAG